MYIIILEYKVVDLSDQSAEYIMVHFYCYTSIKVIMQRLSIYSPGLIEEVLYTMCIQINHQLIHYLSGLAERVWFSGFGRSNFYRLQLLIIIIFIIDVVWSIIIICIIMFKPQLFVNKFNYIITLRTTFLYLPPALTVHVHVHLSNIIIRFKFNYHKVVH